MRQSEQGSKEKLTPAQWRKRSEAKFLTDNLVRENNKIGIAAEKIGYGPAIKRRLKNS